MFSKDNQIRFLVRFFALHFNEFLNALNNRQVNQPFV